MDLAGLGAVLGIDIPMEKLQPYSPVPDGRKEELCSLELIERLEQRFAMFGDYYDDVKAGFEDLKNDPARREYLNILCLYLKDSEMPEAGSLVYPPYIDTPASAMMPLLAHLPSIEGLYDNMRRRGFTHDEAKATLSIYHQYMYEEKHYRGRYVGISPSIANWMAHFTKGNIFYPGYAGLNFQLLNIAHNDPYFLRNRHTGEIQPLFGDGREFHRSGILLGSAGAEDEDGMFTAHFEETDTEYIGNPSRKGLTSRERERFSKDDWELVLKPLDRVLTTHIFFDADLSPDQLDIAFREAKRMAREYYPECGFKGIYCSSWMMNPLIGEILGERSKIHGFASRYTRYQKKSAGTMYRSFLYPGKYETDEELPENTTLQREFKKHLLAGGHIYEVPGIIIF